MKRLTDFETRQPFAVRFFTEALATSHMVNAYVLRGRDFATMYAMVLRLAQIINCTQSPGTAEACGQCQSCRWIDENAHPGVITVSNLTFLTHVDAETGLAKSKTGKPQQSIVVEQLENLLKELSLHSGGFHRVVILTGAQEVPAEEGAPLSFHPPRDWAAQQDGQLRLLPLDRKLFPDRLSNKFLKTLEEPPLDVLFFLLTDSEEKLLDTIVSRCQLVPFATPPSFHRVDLTPTACETFQQLLHGFLSPDFMAQTKTLTDFCAGTGLSTPDALVQFQHFLWEKVHHAPSDPQRFQSLRAALDAIDLARRMIESKAREEAVLEDLFLHLTRANTLSISPSS